MRDISRGKRVYILQSFDPVRGKAKAFDCQVRQVKQKSLCSALCFLDVFASALFTATNNKLSTELLRSFPWDACRECEII